MAALAPVNAVAGQLAADLARLYEGVPYLYGGTSPGGFDCSGLVWYAYKIAAGVTLPRVADGQWRESKRIGLDEARPGDLIFFRGSLRPGEQAGHVGIYLGNGQMIDAPDVGQPVRVHRIDERWYADQFLGFGRPQSRDAQQTQPVPALPSPSPDPLPPQEEPFPPGFEQPHPAPGGPSDSGRPGEIGRVGFLGAQVPDLADPDLWQRAALVVLGLAAVVLGVYLGVS
jgi:NlpC/P60 family